MRLEDVLTEQAPAPPAEARFQWGVVTAVSPLRVQLDAPDDAPLNLTPDKLVPLALGDRVWCQLYRQPGAPDGDGRRVVVLGKAV